MLAIEAGLKFVPNTFDHHIMGFFFNTYNILVNSTTYTYTTDTWTTLQYDTKKKNNLMKYVTIYNTILMLLRTIPILEYNYKINLINN